MGGGWMGEWMDGWVDGWFMYGRILDGRWWMDGGWMS